MSPGRSRGSSGLQDVVSVTDMESQVSPFLTGLSRKLRALSIARWGPHKTLEIVGASPVFIELQNAQAVVLPYDGVNPLPPQLCYLKPHYLDVQTSYFDHLAHGSL